MPNTSDDRYQSHFTADDLAKLKSVVMGQAKGLSQADVDDIIGEILLSACVSSSRPNSTAPLVALAFGYAKLSSYYATARKARDTVADKDPMTFEWISTAVATNSTLSLDVRNTLATIDPESRQIIWMCDVVGMTLAESATHLGIGTTTAHRRLNQAHQNFKLAWLD